MYNYCCMEYNVQRNYLVDDDGTVGPALERSSRFHVTTRDQHLWRPRKTPTKQAVAKPASVRQADAIPTVVRSAALRPSAVVTSQDERGYKRKAEENPTSYKKLKHCADKENDALAEKLKRVKEALQQTSVKTSKAKKPSKKGKLLPRRR